MTAVAAGLRRGALALLCLSAAALAGCGPAGPSFEDLRPTPRAPKRTAEEHAQFAVSDAPSDQRRAALVELANGPAVGAPWAVETFRTIALLERDPQTRCVAIRALGRSGDSNTATTTFLQMLAEPPAPADQVRPPGAAARWDATIELARLMETGSIDAARTTAVEAALIARLADEDKNVRIAAAGGLGHCATRTAVDALIERLRDEQFGVVHACELSLARLTGETHDCDPVAWTAWVEANRATLFAKRGTMPESRRPPYSNDRERMTYNMKQVTRWAFPPAKRTAKREPLIDLAWMKPKAEQKATPAAAPDARPAADSASATPESSASTESAPDGELRPVASPTTPESVTSPAPAKTPTPMGELTPVPSSEPR